jgi:type VI secretion system secreted protein Hcp
VPLIGQAFVGGSEPVDIDFANLVQEKPQSYLDVRVDDTLISGYSMSSGGDRPSEALSLNYDRIRFFATASDGTTQSFVFDVSKQASAGAAPSASLVSEQSQVLPAAATVGSDPIYMKYGGIEGEVTTEGFAGAEQVGSFQWGVQRAIGTNADGQRIATAPIVSQAVITKNFDSTSVPLIEQAFGNDPAHVEFDFVDLPIGDGPAQAYLTIELDNTLISGYSTSSGGDRPSESLSLDFTRISVHSFSNGQAQDFQFDLSKNT